MSKAIPQLEPKWKQRDVPLGKIQIPPHAQRRLNDSRVDYLLANLNLEAFGLPVVSARGGHFYVVDGQHRIKAIIRWLGDGWEQVEIACRVFEGLTEADESNLFDRNNDQLQVNAFDKYKVRVAGGRKEEVAVNRIVTATHLVVSRDKVPGAIMAVGTLMRVYRRSDGETLGKALRIARDAYGDAGMEAPVIDGLGHLCQRYDGVLQEKPTVEALAAAHGGVKGLLNRAGKLHGDTGDPFAKCVAAAAVEFINHRRKGRDKLLNWWKSERMQDEE